MATWKKILREDYAVGSTDGLIEFSSSNSGQVLSLAINDARTGPTENNGLETVAITFGDQFTIGESGGAPTISLPNLIFTDGTNQFNALDTSSNDTITFSSTDGNIAIDTATDGTIDISLSENAVISVGSTDETPNVDLAIGDILDFTSDTVEVVATSTTPGVVNLDIEVNAITVTDNQETPATADFVAGQTNITFDSSDDSVAIAVTGGGTNALVIDLVSAGTPQVDEAASDGTVYSLLMHTGGTGDLDARIDTTIVTGESYGSGPTYTPSTGTLTVANLTVNGVTTQVDTTNLNVADKIITIANGAGSAASAANSGIVVNTGAQGEPTVLWANSGNLSGWQVGRNGTATKRDIAIMSYPSSIPAAAGDGMGVGSFAYHNGIAYIYVD